MQNDRAEETPDVPQACPEGLKDYLRLSKSKKRSGKAIRSAVRKQLQYIRRNIGYYFRD